MYNDFKGRLGFEAMGAYGAYLTNNSKTDDLGKFQAIQAYAPTWKTMMTDLAKHASQQFESGTPMDIPDMMLRMVTADKWMDNLTFPGTAAHTAGIRDPAEVVCDTCDMNFGRFIRTFETLDRYFAPVFVDTDGTPTPLILKARIEFSKVYGPLGMNEAQMTTLSSVQKMNVFADPPGGLKTFLEVGATYDDIFGNTDASVPLYNDATCEYNGKQFYPC